nr:PAS domain S-box protein [Desulfospira joergensenii]
MPIILLGLLSLCFVAYKSIDIVIERELSNSMLMSVGKSAESINRWLTTIMLEPETIASTPAAKLINENFRVFDLQNINRHKLLHEKYPDIFQDIYAANRKGEYHTVQQKGTEFSLFVGNIANRPYFKSIMAGGPTQITPPLISRTTGIPTIFMVAPILDDENRPQGLVGAGISLKYIQEIAQELKAGKTGYGFIITRDGTYIYHPDSSYIMKKKITELKAPSERDLGKNMISGGSGMYRYAQNKRKMVAFYQPIPITNWSVATVLPEAELFAPAIKMMRLLIIITIAFVCLIGSAIFYAMYRLTDPLQRLAARTQQIAAGNFKEAHLEVVSDDEIGILSKSFNDMVDSLKNEKEEVKNLIDQLKESEALFRSQFEFGNIGIAIAQNNEWIRINKRMCTMLGCSQKELMGKTWPRTSGSGDRADTLVSYKRMLDGEIESYETEERYHHKNGHAVFTHVNVSCFRNPDRSVRFVIASFLDITERKAAEKDLIKAKTYINSIIDSMPSILIGVDHDLKITQWNKAAAEATGVHAVEAKGRMITDVFLNPNLNTKTIVQSIDNRITRHLPKVPHKSGNEMFYSDIAIYPLIMDDIEDAVIRIDDVTEKVKMEEVLVQNEKMLSVGGLAAGMAHEINNPLAGMIQSASVMKSRLQDLDIPANQRAAQEIGISMEDVRAFMEKRDIPRMVDAISESGRRAAEIVDSMLSFARKTEADVSSYPPDLLMDQILELASTDYDLKKRYDFKTIEIIKQYDENLPLLICEGAKIQQVILNILRNGAQAMQMAGTQSPRFILRIYVEKDSEMVCMEMEDNGPGMDEKTRSMVFDPFFTTKSVGVGTGLGLSVSYFIITENHGGTLDVVSEPGKGANFIIRLPLHSEKN